MSETGVLKVLTVEGRPPRSELEGDGDIRVVASVNRQQVLRALRREIDELDAVVLRPVDGDPFQLVREIRTEYPHCDVVVTGVPADAAALLEAVEAGVRGYVPKGVPDEQLRRVIRAVAAGDPAFPRRLLGPLLDLIMERRAKRDRALRRLWKLTQRERGVLALLTEGRSNDAMARALGISPQTVRKHVQHVLGKLGVHSRLEAVSFVLSNELQDEVAHALPSGSADALSGTATR